MTTSLSVLLMSAVVVGVAITHPVQNDVETEVTNMNTMFPHFRFCDACKTVVRLAVETVDTNKTIEFFMKEVVDICRMELYLLELRGDIMCPGFIRLYGPVVLFVASNLILDPTRTCEDLNFCARPLSSLPPISSTYRRGLSTVTRESLIKERYNTSSRRKENSKPVTVVQLADVHVDSRYAEGSPTDCKLVACCRTEYNGTGKAGRFGDYNCDIPWRTVQTVLEHVITLDPRPDFIIYSGDSPPHDIWEETWNSQLQNDIDVIKFLTSHLPGIPIYPTLGNHETFPQSQYYQPHKEYEALNKHTATWWHDHFHIPRDQMDNMQYSAFYTVLVRPGLRMLSFNANYWYAFNFYSLLNYKVPAHVKQMEFMEETLRNASIHNEKVIMNAHIPPGNFPEGLLDYGDFYTQLTKRYADTIVMHAFGHTHHSVFELMTDPDDSTSPIAVMLAAPSVTSEGKVNPAYRVYKLDGDTYELLDYDQYYINLTRANEMGVATVEHAYTLTSEYGLPDASPTSYYKLIQRMKKDDSLFKRHRRNAYALSGLEGHCDYLCKHIQLCDMSSASTRAAVQCYFSHL